MPTRTQTTLVAVAVVVLVSAAAIHGRLGDDDPSSVPPLRANDNNKTHTHIYFLLDRSGSMQSIADDVIGGFNAFVKDQTRDVGSTTLPTFLSLIQFDDRDPFECVIAREPITNVKALTSDTFEPRGLTPLLDAIGSVIEHASKDDEGQEDKRAENTVVVVFSDGAENASRKHSREAVFESIKEREKAGWTFVFLGANQDSYTEAGGLGYSRGSTQNFKFDSEGVKSAFHSLSRASSSMNEKLYAQSMGQDTPRTKRYASANFFAGIKEAEADMAARGK